MKNRQIMITLLLTAMMLFAAGCKSAASSASSSSSEISSGSAAADDTPDLSTEAVLAATETTASDTLAQLTLTGKIDNIKDFMFTVTTDSGDAYSLPLSSDSPVDLKDIKSGDMVTVIYTGDEVSPVDANDVTVISVTKN